MKLVPTREQRDLAAMLRAVLADHCPMTLVRALKEPGSDGRAPGLWSALADTGVLGLAVDEHYGGGGAGLAELGVFFTEAGRVLCPTIVYDTQVFGLALARLGTPRQRRAHLPALAAGRLRASVAAWNPSDAGQRRPTLTARRTGDGWTVRGTLPYVSNAAGADLVLVTARTAGYGEPDRVLGLLVDTAAEGWLAQPLRTMAGDQQSRVRLDDVAVPDDAVLAGPDGRGLAPDDLARVAHAAVALQCAEMAGGAEEVVRRTVEYIAGREQFGRPIGSFQAAQHLVADMHIAVQAARLSAARAVWWLGRGELATRPVAIAAMHAGEAYKHATLTAHQLHGGMGYVRDTDLHLFSERAKVAEVRGGTADVAAGWLGKELGLA